MLNVIINVCNLEPLELRRIRMDMLFVYKLLHGCVKCNLLDYVNISTRVHSIRRNLFKLNNLQAKLIMRHNQSIIRCVKLELSK